jgi:hypothetical protein
VKFVVDKVALGQVFSEYSGAGTIGQILADVPSGLSHPTPRNLKKMSTRATPPNALHSPYDVNLPICGSATSHLMYPVRIFAEVKNILFQGSLAFHSYLHKVHVNTHKDVTKYPAKSLPFHSSVSSHCISLVQAVPSHNLAAE